jgi:hypothetical protein
MRKTVFAAAALAAALSLGASADRAVAMTGATPTELGLATADSGLVQKAALVCGRWGCRRVWRGARVWSGPRRRIYAFAGPGPAWGWSGPAWGWSRGWRGPGWGW